MSLTVVRRFGFALLLGAGCHQRPARPFEVELEGHLRGEVGDGHRVVFVATEPCDPDELEQTRTVAMALLGPAAKDGAFGAEASAHEGTRFYLCAFALDATDHAVAFGQYAHNPIVLPRGMKSEVELEDLEVVLSSIAPRALSKGRYRGR